MASVINVRVNTFSGECLELSIDSNGSVSDLEAIVRTKTGEDRFRLGSKGNFLPNKTLKDVGVDGMADISMWKKSVQMNQASRKQALGRIARGTQVSGASIKHSIEKVVNTRANAIEDKLTENKVLAEATGENVSAALHILRGGEASTTGNTHELVNQNKIQKTLLENERKNLNKRAQEEKVATKLATSQTLHDAAVVAEGALQTGFQDIDSVQKCVEMGKALAARKRQLKLEEAVVVEGQPAEKKPRKGSKAWKAAEAAKALAVPDALQLEANATDLAASDEEDTLRDPVMDVAALSAVSVVSTTN